MTNHVAGGGASGAVSTRVYVQLALAPDMSVHLPYASLLELKDALCNRPDASLIVTANIDVHPSSRQGQLHFGAAARRVLCSPNAGGRCLVSEVLSVELMDRLFGVHHVMTEMEIQYATLGPITDYACRVTALSRPGAGDHDDSGIGPLLGVSVTRAMAYQRRFTAQDALRLLTKKTHGIVRSSATVVGCNFERQILHIWVSCGSDAAIVRRVCAKLPSHLRSNTIVLITTINVDDFFWR